MTRRHRRSASSSSESSSDDDTQTDVRASDSSLYQLCVTTISITNTFIALAGAVLLLYGVIGMTSPSVMTFLFDSPVGICQSTVLHLASTMTNSAGVLLTVGAILCIFGFSGFFGMTRHNSLLLLPYWFTLIILLFAEVCFISFAVISPSVLETDLQKLMLQSLAANFKPERIDPSTGNITMPAYIGADVWMATQVKLGCCGVMGPSDYMTFDWDKTFILADGVNMIVMAVPPSCCLTTHSNELPKNILDDFIDLATCLIGKQYFHTQGCYDSIKDLVLNDYWNTTAGLALVIIAFQMLAVGTVMSEWRAMPNAR